MILCKCETCWEVLFVFRVFWSWCRWNCGIFWFRPCLLDLPPFVWTAEPDHTQKQDLSAPVGGPITQTPSIWPRVMQLEPTLKNDHYDKHSPHLVAKFGIKLVVVSRVCFACGFCRGYSNWAHLQKKQCLHTITKTFCSVESDDRSTVTSFSSHLTDEVCGHSAVWVPDSNALWSPYVLGSIPQAKDVHN